MNPMPQSNNQQSPTYGFQPQAQPEYIGYLKQVLDALADPRNQWIGTGLMGGTVKGLGGLRGFFEHQQPLKNPGGFYPQQAPQHYSTASQRLSSNPTSYADTLDTRWKAMDQMVQSGQAEGMAKQQALDAVKQLNMLPPGFDETMAMRNYRPSQN